MMNDILWALLGGVLIGLSASLLLIFNGRVMGVTGIIYGIVNIKSQEEKLWRFFFLGGMLLGGIVGASLRFDAIKNTLNFSPAHFLIAGGIVGFGSLLGSGCTSGHGICGISRLSVRSIVATMTFIVTGVLTVAMMRWLGWLG